LRRSNLCVVIDAHEEEQRRNFLAASLMTQ